MERKNVNLTKEQCQEIIEEIVTTSLHGFESGNAQVKAELKGTGIEISLLTILCPNRFRLWQGESKRKRKLPLQRNSLQHLPSNAE